MADQCRDWLSTLWPASFKGVPFYFEKDKEEGGRGLVIHKFPNRDTPFIEDLGEEPRTYSGSAYVHGDDADSLADNLKQALASRGAGTLVVPYFGPVTVHCQTFERATERDTLGYVAFDLKFVRKGADSPFASVALLQNVAYQTADNTGRLLGEIFPRSVVTAAQPDYVVGAIVETLSSAAAMVDMMRTTYPVDPVASAVLRDRVARFLGDVDAGVTNLAPSAPAIAAVAADLIEIVRGVADAMPAESAVRAMSEFVESFASPAIAPSIALPSVTATAPVVLISAEPYKTQTRRITDRNRAAAARLVRLAGLTAYAEATLRRTFVARPDGVTARAQVAERFEAELQETTGADNAALYVSILSLRGSVIEWLSRTINDLAPVMIVESARILPSLALAWTLYGDPLRGAELAARNRVRHPSFMPREITALAR